MSKRDADAASGVFAYLSKQNRPYSTIDIFNNLHKEIGKSAVQKALDQLVVDGKILEKVYGKQKVYAVNQSNFSPVNDTENRELDCVIAELNEKLEKSQNLLKQYESQLSKLNGTLTTSDASQLVVKLTDEVSALQQKLSAIKENRHQVPVEDKKKITKEYEKYKMEWRKRKRIVNDMMDAVLEGYPKGKNALCDEAGIETDESVKVTFPN